MVGKRKVIETGVDKLVRIVNCREKISVKEAAKELGVSVASIEEWADFLEEESIINVQSHLATVFLVRRPMSKKELAEKVAEVRDEKDNFLRSVESSANALARDHDEVKLIDKEFSKMKSLLEDNFTELSKKLKKLEDFKVNHREIESRRQDLEKAYEKKLGELDNHLKDDQKAYERIMVSIDAELANINKERESVDQLKMSEKVLQTKVDEVNRMIADVKKQIDVQNEHLADDAERLKTHEERAKNVRADISSGSNALDEMNKKVMDSRKELESMEKEFLQDLEKMGRGDIEKIGPYRESKELMLKFKDFLSHTDDVETLISKAEHEEEELHKRFAELEKKVKTFSVVTSIQDIKKQMEALRTELKEIESKKGFLASQLKKLRSVMRAVAKT